MELCTFLAWSSSSFRIGALWLHSYFSWWLHFDREFLTLEEALLHVHNFAKAFVIKVYCRLQDWLVLLNIKRCSLAILVNIWLLVFIVVRIIQWLPDTCEFTLFFTWCFVNFLVYFGEVIFEVLIVLNLKWWWIVIISLVCNNDLRVNQITTFSKLLRFINSCRLAQTLLLDFLHALDKVHMLLLSNVINTCLNKRCIFCTFFTWINIGFS